MEDLSNKILVLTNVVNGVCLNDPFIALVNDLSSSLGRESDYFTFDKNPTDKELEDYFAKDTLDRLSGSIGKYEFVIIDKRLSKEILNFVIGFLLSEGAQIGSFYINDSNLQEFVESKVILRKGNHPEEKTTLKVCPDGMTAEEYVPISEAFDELITSVYSSIEFLEGNYDEDSLYRVLSYCYDSGVIVTKYNNSIENSFIKVITLKW